MKTLWNVVKDTREKNPVDYLAAIQEKILSHLSQVANEMAFSNKYERKDRISAMIGMRQ